MLSGAIEPLDLASLRWLMEHTAGRWDIAVGVLDGPPVRHRALAGIHHIGTSESATATTSWAAQQHGTCVAGVLNACRNQSAPGICPQCPLLVYPIFHGGRTDRTTPNAEPGLVASAIVKCVDAGVRLINISAGFARLEPGSQHRLQEALSYAARRGVLIIAAAGNQATLGSSSLTRHPWVLPVVACDAFGNPTAETTLGPSVGSYGVRAPGQVVTFGVDGAPVTFGGTSAAAALTTGTAALLWSMVPTATSVQIRSALRGTARRASVVPPLLSVTEAYRTLAQHHGLHQSARQEV